MALAKNKTAGAQANNAQFEQMDNQDTAVMEKESTVVGGPDLSAVEGASAAADTGTTADLNPASAEDAAAATAAAAKAATEANKPSADDVAKATTTAIAAVKMTAIAQATKKFTGALTHLENVFDPATLDFNTFPRIVVGLDGFSNDSNIDLGKEIGLEVMSFNTRWTLSPGVDSEEAKQHVRFSLDGKTLDCPNNPAEHGMAVQDYLNVLKSAHGYDDAALKEYVAIYGFLTFANGAIIDPAEREIVGVQVPPQSRALFNRYQLNQGVLIQRKLAPAHPGIRLMQEKQTAGTRKFASIKFAAEKDAEVISTFFVAEAE